MPSEAPELAADLTPANEQVVLLDEAGRAVGVADKRLVHHRATPLHLAFSCYVFNPRGDLLVSRRALEKATFPGVWTNTACGHPGPGEGFLSAVRRRTAQELGISLQELRVVLPRFRYRAVMGNGVVENEICPVVMARTTDVPHPDRDEVDATAWVPWVEFRDSVLGDRQSVSPWCADQVALLEELNENPLGWPAAALSDLPPAARPFGAPNSEA